MTNSLTYFLPLRLVPQAPPNSYRLTEAKFVDHSNVLPKYHMPIIPRSLKRSTKLKVVAFAGETL